MLQRALDEQRALQTAVLHRDPATRRPSETIDPLRVFEMDGRSYLEAWCRSAEGGPDLPGRSHRGRGSARRGLRSRPRESSFATSTRAVYQPASEHLLATLRIAAPYAWVADYYPAEEVLETDGQLQVSLRVADPAWVRALVLGSSGQVAVLSPDWLAASIITEAETAIGRLRLRPCEVESATCSGSRSSRGRLPSSWPS